MWGGGRDALISSHDGYCVRLVLGRLHGCDERVVVKLFDGWVEGGSLGSRQGS